MFSYWIIHMCFMFIFFSRVWTTCSTGSITLISRYQTQWVVIIILIVYYCDFIVGTMASQITTLTIVYSIVHSGADQRKHQSSASLAFVCGIYWWPVNSPHKVSVTQKVLPFYDVIMIASVPIKIARSHNVVIDHNRPIVVIRISPNCHKKSFRKYIFIHMDS